MADDVKGRRPTSKQPAGPDSPQDEPSSANVAQGTMGGAGPPHERGGPATGPPPEVPPTSATTAMVPRAGDGP
jgi:hypothetical protein